MSRPYGYAGTAIERWHHTRIRGRVARVLLSLRTFAPYSRHIRTTFAPHSHTFAPYSHHIRTTFAHIRTHSQSVCGGTAGDAAGGVRRTAGGPARAPCHRRPTGGAPCGGWRVTVVQGIAPDLSDLHQIREIRTTFAPYSHCIRSVFARIRAYSRKGRSVFTHIRTYSHTYIPIHTCECAKKAALDSRDGPGEVHAGVTQ